MTSLKRILIISAVTIGCFCLCVFSVPLIFILNSLARALTPIPNMSRYVTEDELIGVWIPTPGTERLIARYKPSGAKPLKCHLTLHKDGTCDFDSVYDCFDSLEYRKSSGTWKLKHDTETGSYRRMKNSVEFDMNEPRGAGDMYLRLTERRGKLILWEWYSDPDCDEFIRYMKEEPDTK